MKSFTQYQMMEATKSECEKKFEKYLFGDFLKKGEKNTDNENIVFGNLAYFIKTGTWKERQIPAVIKSIKELKACQKYYKEILTPTAKIAYRGGKISIKNLNPKSISSIKIQNRDAYLIPKQIYKPSGPVQSWSADVEIASSFKASKKDSELSCTYRTAVDNSFLMSHKFMNKLDKFLLTYIDSGESEMIRISKKPVRVDCIIIERYYAIEYKYITNLLEQTDK